MMPQTDKKNMIIAIAISAAIIFGWQFFYEMPRLEKQRAAQQAAMIEQAASGNAVATQAPTTAPVTGAPATTSAPGDASVSQQLPRADALAQSPRLAIDSPKLTGSIALKGGRVDDLVLKNYRETIAPDSPNVVLLTPANSLHGYIAETGWWAPAGTAVPNATTVWSADAGAKLTPQSPVTLTWDNGAGLVFTRKISIDDGYMFKVEDSVANNGAAAVSLSPYSRVARFGLPPSPSQTYVLHEGPMGVFDGTLNEEKYGAVKSHAEDAEANEPKSMDHASTGGWVGISDKYWLVAQVAPADAKITAHYLYDPKFDSYQADYVADQQAVAPGAGASFTHQVFAGAKEVTLLETYRDNLGIPLFERAVDFGWFFFLTKPLHAFLDWIVRYIGNMGLAILLLTVCVKAVMFPLANKSYASMSKMKALQPKMAELKEQFGEDKARFQQEMMALYKKEKVNPAAGCLPIVVQIPVFYALYKVLYVTIDMRQAPFFGWIHDLSMPDPTTFLNLFGLIPWDPHLYFNMPIVGAILHLLSIGVWPLIMGFTMWAQMRLNPTPPDPVQAKMFAVMPFIFTFMLGSMPAGLVIYWAWNNTLSIAQQKYIMYSQAKKSAKQPKKA
jgi:YidC/Oxa1 family membrane protein insertase